MAAEQAPGAAVDDSKRVRLFRIDVHTHIIPEHMPDWSAKFGYGDFVKLKTSGLCSAHMYKGDKFFREIQDNCFRAEPRLKQCDSHGVVVQVLSTVPVMFSYHARPKDTLEMARFLNDHIAAVVKKHPKRFIGLGTVPMQDPELAVKELRRCVQELGFAGIQIGTRVNEWRLSEPALFPVFAEAEKLGACIFVHPWDMPGTDKDKYWLPWLVGMPMETCHAICSLIFGGVLERLPKLRVGFAHGGGSFAGTIGRIEHGFRVRPDLCAVDNKKSPRTYLGKFWVDSLVHDDEILEHIVRVFGPARVLLGSDYPFPLGEDEPGLLVESSSRLDEATKRQILWDNAVEFLGIKGEDFL